MMLERTYNEAIYGYDFFSLVLNETDYILWLQKENSNEKLSLTSFSNLNLGTPSIRIPLDEAYGNNNMVYSGEPTLKNREFSFSIYFKPNSKNIALNQERLNFIKKWIEYDSNNKLYLYWHIKEQLKTYRIEVRSSLGSEKYNTQIISNSIDVNLISEKAYFECVEETKLIFDFSQQENNIQINNIEFETPFNILFQASENFNSFEVYNQYGYGFKSNYNFKTNDVLYINMADGFVKINNIIATNFFNFGTIFNLNIGTNIINFKTGRGQLTITYFNRIR